MAEILVLVDHADGEVKKVTGELLTLARRHGEPSAVFIGSGYDKAADALGRYGATRAYVADDAELDDYVVAPKTEVLARLVTEKAPSAVLVASAGDGPEVGARLAVRVGGGIITDAVELTEGLVAEQSAFGGATVVHSRVRTGTPVFAVRPNSTAPETLDAPAPPAEERTGATISDAARGARVVERVAVERGARPASRRR